MLSALYVKEIYVFALSEKVTRISLSSNLYWSLSESILVSVQTYIGRRVNLYWSAYEPILVDDRTSTGHASNQYWSAREAVLVTIGDQYWSDYRPVLVAPPLLRVRCEAYVYEGIVRDALLG